MSTKQLNPQQYDQAIEIMRNLREDFKPICDTYSANRHKGHGYSPFQHIRSFSEGRANGRRLKLWGIDLMDRDPLYTRMCIHTHMNDLMPRYVEGLRLAGWKLTHRVYGSGQSPVNIAFYLEKI